MSTHPWEQTDVPCTSNHNVQNAAHIKRSEIIKYKPWHESIEGPANSTISRYYYYYEQKPLTLARFVDAYGCATYEEYPTPMDGINGWACNLWSECSNEAEIVGCTGIHGHWYPFGNEDPPYIGGTRILWDFMKRHRKKLSN